MMLLENVIGVKMYLTSCIGAAALVLTGVLTEREALNSIHQPTISYLPVCWLCRTPSRPPVQAMWWQTG